MEGVLMPLRRLSDKRRSSDEKNYGLRVLGDNQPFSTSGKNPSYFLEWGKHSLLIDLGTSPFEGVAPEKLANIDGVLITHIHLDHCRYFSDLALYFKYNLNKPLKVIAGYMVLKNLRLMFEKTLIRSLDNDLGKTKTFKYEDFVEEERIGPIPRAEINHDPKNGYHIQINGPTKILQKNLKAIGGKKNSTWWLLYHSPSFKGWIDPFTFYSYENPEFYYDPKPWVVGGLSFRLVNAHAWHGMDVDGLLIEGFGTQLFFTSDTVYNLAAWKRLLRKRRAIKAKTLMKSKTQFVEGEIEDYIEQFWSQERYDEAMKLYETPLILHDVGNQNSIVHTEYKEVLDIRSRLIFIHTPDNFLSAVPFVKPGSAYQIENNDIFEIIEDIPKPLHADLYLKEGKNYLVGFSDKNGEYSFAGLRRQYTEGKRRELTRVKLYLDKEGRYLNWPIDENAFYHLKKDGKVVLVKTDKKGVEGNNVADLRDSL